MKTLSFLCALLVSVPFLAQGQLWLNAGDTYTYEFTNFGFNGTFPGTPAGATFATTMSWIDGNEGYLLEIFENNTSEPPLMTFNDIRFVPNPLALGNAWLDRQGVVRFTVTSGSVSLDLLYASIVYANGDMYTEIFDIMVGDSDGDGVLDDQDQCPNTAPGAPVDGHGCSIAQLAPCEGPTPGAAWKNHGQYIHVVGSTLTQFLGAGLITHDEAHDIFVEAAKSGCGTVRGY